jgi:K+-sensing histidine kinase KdpD
VIIGTPNESRRREILRGSLVAALVRNLPGIDVRVVANRADRELQP